MRAERATCRRPAQAQEPRLMCRASSRTHPAHAELGRLELFIVPIGPGQYEAIFTWRVGERPRLSREKAEGRTLISSPTDPAPRHRQSSTTRPVMQDLEQASERVPEPDSWVSGSDSTSSASTPRCGSTSGSGFGRSTTGGVSVHGVEGRQLPTSNSQLPRRVVRNIGVKGANKLARPTLTPFVRTASIGSW